MLEIINKTTETYKAYAKINLTLRVLGKRDDGYHNIYSVMQAIDLADVLRITKNDTGKTTVSWSIDEEIDDANTVIKAARLMSRKFGIEDGVHVDVLKNIPISAGLAGGSADAAAVLIGMNELFGLGLSAEALFRLGREIGADVPFCVMSQMENGAALSEGIGEILTPLDVSETLRDAFIVLAKPPVSVSTKEAYEGMSSFSEAYYNEETQALLDALKTGDLRLLCRSLKNDMEESVLKKCPVIAEIKRELLAAGAFGALMSGSGSCVYGVFDDESTANAARSRIRESGLTEATFINKLIL